MREGQGAEGVMGDKGRDEPGVLGYIGGGQGKRPAVWSDPTFAHSSRTTSLEITARIYILAALHHLALTHCRMHTSKDDEYD